MGEFKVNLDISGLVQYLDSFAKEVVKDIQKGIKGLTIDTRAHIIEEANKKLDKWDQRKYLENLGQATQINDFLWEIELNTPAHSIENGREAWDTKGVPGQWGLLKKPDGIVKSGPNEGKHYKVIPMEQGKEHESFDPKKLAHHKEMVDTIKSFLGTKRLSTGKLEIDSRTGSPRISRTNPKTGLPVSIRSFDIPSKVPGEGNTPQLYRLNIYQVKNEKTGKVNRVMTTFRTAIEGDGKWMHKGVAAVNLFEDAKKFAEQEWDNSWLTKILQKYQGK